MQPLENEIRSLIADALMLEDEIGADFDPEADLFATLGLDSVDALEIAMAIKRAYGVEMQQDDEQGRAAFQSLRALAQWVEAHRGDGVGH